MTDTGSAIMSDSAPMLVCLPDERLREEIGDVAGVQFVHWDWDSPAPHEYMDIIVPPYMSSPSLLTKLEGVHARLVQSQSIGFDRVADFLPPSLAFAIATSVHETSTAELAVALILSMQRGIPGFARDGDRGEWSPKRLESLADKQVLIVGYGGVGQAIESRLAPFEATITRVARSAKILPQGEVHPIGELDALVPGADIIVLAVPLDDDTYHLVDSRFLDRMCDGALLVNVARGPVVDTDALMDHLHRGRIRAAVDVTDPEPLPADHPLWRCPNVLVTPHVGGASSAMLPRMARLLRQQIELMRAEKPPVNVVLEPKKC